MTKTMITPCVNVCVMESARGICAGCGRTLDEIARWGTMSEAERTRIMASLTARLADHEASRIESR